MESRNARIRRLCGIVAGVWLLGLVLTGPMFAQIATVETCPVPSSVLSPVVGGVEYYYAPELIPTSFVFSPDPAPVVSYSPDPGTLAPTTLGTTSYSFSPTLIDTVYGPMMSYVPVPVNPAPSAGFRSSRNQNVVPPKASTGSTTRPSNSSASGEQRQNYLSPAPERNDQKGRESASDSSDDRKSITPPPPLAGKGRQFGVIEGMVISGTGEPEEEVPIVIRSRGPKVLEKSTTTDSLGRFAVSVTHGDWEVYVKDRDGKQRLAKTISVDKNQIHHLPIYR